MRSADCWKRSRRNRLFASAVLSLMVPRHAHALTLPLMARVFFFELLRRSRFGEAIDCPLGKICERSAGAGEAAVALQRPAESEGSRV